MSYKSDANRAKFGVSLGLWDHDRVGDTGTILSTAYTRYWVRDLISVSGTKSIKLHADEFDDNPKFDAVKMR